VSVNSGGLMVADHGGEASVDAADSPGSCQRIRGGSCPSIRMIRNYLTARP